MIYIINLRQYRFNWEKSNRIIEMGTWDSNIKNPEFASKTREKIFRILILAFAAITISRLGYLQIVKGSLYRSESEAQAIKEEVVEPFRGNIYDRNGLLLVHNEPSFTIKITPSDFHRDRLPLLASILGMDTTDIVKELQKNEKYSQFEQIKLVRDADEKTVSLVEEYSDLLPGIEVTMESKRLYNFTCNMSHLLGYTREVTRDQLEKKQYLRPGDIVGVTGVEANYEDFLKGTKGINFVAVNRSGKKIESFDKGIADQPVSNGFDLYLSIDKRVQEQAEALLADKRGSAVAIDPSNGEVICLVAKPDYDPRKFSGKVPADLFAQLQNDPGNPLFNRALMSQYPPGSTWKMMVACAALMEGAITENTTFTCGGGISYGGRFFKCHGNHGTLNAQRAIAVSCNSFFYQTALRLGLEKMMKWATMFGFGQQTHIDIPNEGSGILPTIEWLNRRFGEGKYPKGNIVNYGIGQGEISVTPLQMAVYCATLANKNVYQPHVGRSFNNNILKKIQYFDYGQKIPISDAVLTTSGRVCTSALTLLEEQLRGCKYRALRSAARPALPRTRTARTIHGLSVSRLWITPK